MGDNFSCKGHAPTADDADVGIPVSLLVGETDLRSVIACDRDAMLWSYQGKGHPSLGVCVWVELVAGKSLCLTKSSLILIGHPNRRSKSRIQLAFTDKVVAGDANSPQTTLKQQKRKTHAAYAPRYLI